MDSTWTERTLSLPDAGQLRGCPPGALLRLWRDVGLALLAAALTALRVWQARVGARDELRELDARTLADIGLTVEAVAWEIRKPFWEA